MRVVIVTTSFSGGGAEFVALTWARWLAENGHDVRLATTTIHDNGRVPPGVRHIPLAGRTDPATVRSLRRMLAERADVVLALQSLPNLVAVAATRRGGPAVVVSERNITTREGEPTRLADRLKRRLARRWYRRADMTIAVSHAVAAELVSAYGVPGERIVVVPNPARHRAETRAPSKATAGTGRAVPLSLVLPMRLVPQKRVELAVQAAAVLRARGHDVQLVCFATRSASAAVDALATAAGVPLRSFGWVADWTIAAPPNSVALLPSYREGFGNVLVEAAAAGIPSVAVSNAYGVADALIPGVSGELAFVGTPDAVADAILAAGSVDMDRADDWTRRFSTQESGRLLVSALERAVQDRSRRSMAVQDRSRRSVL